MKYQDSPKDCQHPEVFYLYSDPVITVCCQCQKSAVLSVAAFLGAEPSLYEMALVHSLGLET